MTNDINSQPETSKIPTHIAYHVVESEDGKGFWNRIGSAWTHRNGDGFNIKLYAFPIDGRITVRLATEKSK